MKNTLLLFISFLLPYALFAQTQEQSYKIYDVKNKKVTTTEELIKNIKDINVLVFGEEHNDSIGHLLEAEIFNKMLLSYPGTAISMEMFATDVQPIINEYLSSLISEKNFIKEARAWNNYKDYKPLVELAKQNKTDVIGANVSTRYSNAVTYSGLQKLNEFPAASKSFLPPLPIDTATGRYYEKFKETMGGHDMGSMKIFQTQNLWDAAMASSIVKYAKANPKRKIFQVNGRFHSDEKIGTLAQLKKYAPKLNVANISCFAAEDFNDPQWNNYVSLGDYIIVTAPVPAK